jgi:hypothetical protein
MHTFAEIIHQLGPLINIPGLASQENKDLCVIDLNPNQKLFIQLSHKSPEVEIVMQLGSIPPGKYREDFFRACLKANGKNFPRFGNFAYLSKNEQLVLFESIPIDILDGESLYNFILLFSDKAQKYQEAIMQGDIPYVEERGDSNSSNPFGV